MRAISAFKLEAGTSSFCWRALIALRMRVSKSATGSVKLILFSSYRFALVPLGKPVRNVLHERSAFGARIRPSTLHARAGRMLAAERDLFLPGRLGNARDLAPQRQTAEAQAAYAELAQIRPRTPAELAAIVLTSRKLRLPCRLGNMRCSGHLVLTRGRSPFFKSSSSCRAQ